MLGHFSIFRESMKPYLWPRYIPQCKKTLFTQSIYGLGGTKTLIYKCQKIVVDCQQRSWRLKEIQVNMVYYAYPKDSLFCVHYTKHVLASISKSGNKSWHSHILWPYAIGLLSYSMKQNGCRKATYMHIPLEYTLPRAWRNADAEVLQQRSIAPVARHWHTEPDKNQLDLGHLWYCENLLVQAQKSPFSSWKYDICTMQRECLKWFHLLIHNSCKVLPSSIEGLCRSESVDYAGENLD